MSKQTELFQVRNSDWTVTETKSGVYELSTADGLKKIGGLTGGQLASAQAVLAELDRHVKETGGK